MYLIKRGLLKNLDVSIYAKPEFNSWQMDEILSGLENGVDVSVYANPELTWEQMRDIRWRMEYDRSKQ